jgi:SAM-dependent methyltransferase
VEPSTSPLAPGPALAQAGTNAGAAQAGPAAAGMEQVFSRIYRENEWIGSGPGSSAEATQDYRFFLEKFLRLNRIRTVLDVGCGDWRFSRYVPWEGVQYTGMEVVPDVVEANRRRFTDDNLRFVCADARTADLPAADLLLMKDVLQHWTNAEVAQFLPTIRRYPFALVTNTTNRIETNRDCPTGGYRFLDLTRPPFNVDATVVLRWTASVPGRHPDEKSVLLFRGNAE